jgi:hypothetical protein
MLVSSLGPIFFRNVDSPKLMVVSFYEVHWFHFQNGIKFKFLRLLIQTFWQEICFQVLSLFKRTYFSSHTLCDLIALQISKDSRNELVSNFHGEQTQGVWKVRGKKITGVSHCGLAIYIIKYLKAKEEEEEEWKLKYFTMQKYNLQKIL